MLALMLAVPGISKAIAFWDQLMSRRVLEVLSNRRSSNLDSRVALLYDLSCPEEW
jgi:hypothetical protein